MMGPQLEDEFLKKYIDNSLKLSSKTIISEKQTIVWKHFQDNVYLSLFKSSLP